MRAKSSDIPQVPAANERITGVVQLPAVSIGLKIHIKQPGTPSGKTAQVVNMAGNGCIYAPTTAEQIVFRIICFAVELDAIDYSVIIFSINFNGIYAVGRFICVEQGIS